MDYLGNVLIRSDMNVPVSNSIVIDDYRLEKAVEVIPLIRDRSRSVTFISHLGRPKSYIEDLSLKNIVSSLSKYTSEEVQFLNDINHEEISKILLSSNEFNIYLLENLRFYKGEVNNDTSFAIKVASSFDTYIFDAFGSAHRNHASVVKIGNYLNSYQGPLIDKEISELKSITDPDGEPFTLILGGSKISDKLQLIKSLLPKVDNLLIGGAMCFTFFKAMGKNIGDSLYEEDMIGECKKIIQDKNFTKIKLPLDIGVTDSLESINRKDVSHEEIYDNNIGIDIGNRTVELFSEFINKAKIIFWNGPMGIFEKDSFNNGTRAITRLVQNTEAHTIIGGGDTVSAIRKFGDIELVNYVSTGGGASLESLEGKELPGINKYPSLII